MSGHLSSGDLRGLRIAFDRTGGKAWEPQKYDHPWIERMIEHGFFKRVDGRCGFEAMKDAMLTWTTAGRMALAQSEPHP